MSTKEKIAVMQAYLEGKVIQIRNYRFNKWEDWIDWNEEKEPIWNFVNFDYRIKPEPRVLYTVDHSFFKSETSGVVACNVSIEGLKKQLKAYNLPENLPIKKFVEVKE